MGIGPIETGCTPQINAATAVIMIFVSYDKVPTYSRFCIGSDADSSSHIKSLVVFYDVVTNYRFTLPVGAYSTPRICLVGLADTLKQAKPVSEVNLRPRVLPIR